MNEPHVIELVESLQEVLAYIKELGVETGTHLIQAEKVLANSLIKYKGEV